MTFLAPLFLLGALAIAGPILFHLIRRNTKEKFTFSSLMFLRADPPSVTRKSRLEDILHLIHDMDERLVHFYTLNKDRLAGALLLAYVNWMLGVVEIYNALVFLDRPITWAEAWIIEAVAQMVRTGAFFIPAAIGVQEGAFLLVCGAITGSPPIGVAVSVIRRIREVIWIIWGFAVGAFFSLRTTKG